MLRDQMINFLESAVVFLLMTNAVSAAAAAYAVRLANQYALVKRKPTSIERKVTAMLGLST
ncbi:MAG TPA: hypothetical protein VMM15_00535 [Bradyrhizobium sp.]|nr:hypothetical protein [Bradyrhizobium sp.]